MEDSSYAGYTPMSERDLLRLSNCFLIYNLGSEMIYLIHHRLLKIVPTEKKVISVIFLV